MKTENYAARQTVEVTGRIDTPWGKADFATVFGDGITFYSTPGHGGFRLSPERNAELLRKFPGFRTFSGAVGWYEEDCDWAAVALAFPEAFPEVAPSEAQSIFDQYCARRLPANSAATAALAAERGSK